MLNDKIYLTSINQSHHIDHNADQYEEAGHDGEGEEAAEAGAGQQRAGRRGEAEHVAQGAGHRHQPGHRQGRQCREQQHDGEGSWIAVGDINHHGRITIGEPSVSPY